MINIYDLNSEDDNFDCLIIDFNVQIFISLWFGAGTVIVDVPDFLTRHKYLETALKLKRRLVEKVDLTTNGKDLPTPIYGGKSK